MGNFDPPRSSSLRAFVQRVRERDIYNKKVTMECNGLADVSPPLSVGGEWCIVNTIDNIDRWCSRYSV